jgi:uncharacterized protein (DUF433 family)
MSVEELAQYSKDQLIEELINRQTFVGVVVFHRGDAKAGRLEPGEIVITKSPPLSREGVEHLLETGESLVAGMFTSSPSGGSGSAGTLPLHRDHPPLRPEEGGVVRVGTSRISLDLIVAQYENGMTPEDMVRAYDSLALVDVYGAIAYYLRHQELVKEYLARRKEEAEALRAKIEGDRPRISPQELLTRRAAAEKMNAATGE